MATRTHTAAEKDWELVLARPRGTEVEVALRLGHRPVPAVRQERGTASKGPNSPLGRDVQG